MIEIKNLRKTFTLPDKTELVALDDINITINDGEIFGIIGLSGAGKSTLVRCINLLEVPTNGEVVIDGKDITKISKKELLLTRRNIGMIFQSFNLFEQRNVLQNICYPLEIAGYTKSEAKKKAVELLQIVNLSEKAGAYPSQLSGGQKQRVAIARALATEPKYLLCDEATSALDPTTTKQILALLKEINATMGVTVVVITHEMRVIDQICDRVAVINNSHIAEMGNVCEVFANPQSDIAKELILPSSPLANKDEGSEATIRIVFDGETTDKPILSDMIISCNAPVNVLYADTKEINGKSYGNMIIGLPDDGEVREKVFAYLRKNNIKYTKEGK